METLPTPSSSADDLETANAIYRGKQWALNCAYPEQVAAVAALGDIDDEAWFRGEPDAYGWGRDLADAIFGEGEWNRDDLEELHDYHLGTEYPGSHQVRGFIQGVADVFDQR